MWIVAHLQKCQAIKSPHVNEHILIGMERKKCIDFFSLAISRQMIMLNHPLIRNEPLVLSFFKMWHLFMQHWLDSWNECKFLWHFILLQLHTFSFSFAPLLPLNDQEST